MRRSVGRGSGRPSKFARADHADSRWVYTGAWGVVAGPSRPPKTSPIGTNSPRLRCLAYSPMFLLVGADSGLEQNQRDKTAPGPGQEADNDRSSS